MARPSVFSASVAQRVHRGVQILRVGLQAHALVDVELEHRQAARIDGVNGDVVAGWRCRRPRAGLTPCRGRRATLARSSLRSLTPACGLPAFGLPRPGICASALRICGGRMYRVALADEDQRLAPFLQRAHVDDERLERRQRHLIADLLDRFRRVVRVLLFELVLRLVVVLAARETAARPRDTAEWLRVMRTDAGRLERVHHADHVRRPDLRVDEAAPAGRAPTCSSRGARGSRPGRSRTAARRRAPPRTSSS